MEYGERANPAKGSLPCEVVQRFQDVRGRELVRVSTEKPGMESIEGVSEFTVAANLVTTLLD